MESRQGRAVARASGKGAPHRPDLSARADPAVFRDRFPERRRPRRIAQAPGILVHHGRSLAGADPQAPPVTPSDDLRFPNQGYLDPAPEGIDAEFAWTVAGGDGAGQNFVDIEWGWTLNHEDLVAHGISLLSGLNNGYEGHGTAVLGEVAAVDNTLGCVGITPALASVNVIGQWRTAADYDIADAILDACGRMGFGDVLLLEAHTDYNGFRSSRSRRTTTPTR